MDMFYLQTLLLELLEKQYVQLGMLPLTVTLRILIFLVTLTTSTSHRYWKLQLPISMYGLSSLGCLLFGAGCEKLGEASKVGYSFQAFLLLPENHGMILARSDPFLSSLRFLWGNVF